MSAVGEREGGGSGRDGMDEGPAGSTESASGKGLDQTPWTRPLGVRTRLGPPRPHRGFGSGSDPVPVPLPVIGSDRYPGTKVSGNGRVPTACRL